MTDVYGDYRRKNSVREDPRLVRRDSKSSSSSDRLNQQYDKLGVPISPKLSSPKSISSDPRLQDNWQSHQSHTTPQYNPDPNMQTAYQHLPASMYADPNQYAPQAYTTYTTYQQNYANPSTGYNPYQSYNQASNAYSSGNIQPGPPGEEYPQNEWAPVNTYSVPPPPANAHPQQHIATTDKNEDRKKDAVAQELKQQKAQMAKQREEYVRKVSVLKRELELLRNQKQELLAENSPERENNHILKENNKLQIEIQNKMKTIHNVIEMLSNIIGDRLTVAELDEMYKEESPKHRREKNRSSMSTEKNDLNTKFSYIYYDPELHWCRICDVFPKSAKDYLLHLHSKEHRQITQDRDMVDTPWHRLPAEPELPSYDGASKKRMPIKGLQFLISATSWYCKLCDTWVGDLHCASQHLKSQNHNQNYANFVEQNPHWEIEWLRDRDKAVIRIQKERKSDTDDSDNQEEVDNKNKKRRDKHSPDSRKDKKKKKLKKRKKHSSDSSTSSTTSDSSSDNENNDKSKSIHVAMRNKMKLQAQMIMDEDLGGKWEVLDRLVEEHKRKEADKNKEVRTEDALISQWMTVSEPQDKDKRLFNDLRDRMKLKQEAEKARLAEIEQKRREKERIEQELHDKKEREEREAKEREEERRRQEELNRIRDKDREQIRFKTRDKSRRRSASFSPEKNKVHYSRSPSSERKKRDRTPEKYRNKDHFENGRREFDNKKRSPSYDAKESSNNKRKNYDNDSKESDSKKNKKSISSHKKPHFIGRMPLFKNKKVEEKVEKEIKKEDYDIPRQTRFQPGHLARAFIPEPEVVCFPKLSSIPPLMIPPPQPPEPPKISKQILKAPPPPIIKDKKSKSNLKTDDTYDDILPPPPLPPTTDDDELNKELQQESVAPEGDFQDTLSMLYPDPNNLDPMMQYQYTMEYNNVMYPPVYDYSQDVPMDSPMPPLDQIPVEHTMPLQPPPLPPDDPHDDLAMLGMSADDMAAQSF